MKNIMFWVPGTKKNVIPLENLLAIMSMGQGFGAFANNKTEQWLSADTGSKLIKSGQEYSHKQRQTWSSAQAKPSNYQQASTETLLHMTQIWQDWQCHLIIATASSRQHKASLELTAEMSEGLISLWVEHDTQQELAKCNEFIKQLENDLYRHTAAQLYWT